MFFLSYIAYYYTISQWQSYLTSIRLDLNWYNKYFFISIVFFSLIIKYETLFSYIQIYCSKILETFFLICLNFRIRLKSTNQIFSLSKISNVLILNLSGLSSLINNLEILILTNIFEIYIILLVFQFFVF